MISRPPASPTARYDMEFIPETAGDLIKLISGADAKRYVGDDNREYKLITPPQLYGENEQTNLKILLTGLADTAASMLRKGEMSVRAGSSEIEGLEKIADAPLPDSWRFEWVGYLINSPDPVIH